MRFIISNLVLIVALSAAPVFAANDSARAQLDRFSNGLHSLSGTFSQRTITANGEIQDESGGSLALQAPRQFRWHYEQPFEQLIVADGTNVWIYDEDLEQVTVRSQSQEEAQSPLTLLIDPAQLDRDFSVRPLQNADGLSWLELIAKEKEPAFKRIRIGMGKAGPEQMNLVDLIDNTTEWQFGDWKRNP